MHGVSTEFDFLSTTFRSQKLLRKRSRKCYWDKDLEDVSFTQSAPLKQLAKLRFKEFWTAFLIFGIRTGARTRFARLKANA